jgi:hypothetical protein
VSVIVVLKLYLDPALLPCNPDVPALPLDPEEPLVPEDPDVPALPDDPDDPLPPDAPSKLTVQDVYVPDPTVLVGAANVNTPVKLVYVITSHS